MAEGILFSTLCWDRVQVGETLPAVESGPISRATLALFAGASGDHNPMHIDADFARRAGAPDVFVHGMLVMAYAGRLLTNWAPQQDLREFSVRFTAITRVHEEIICCGTVAEKFEAGGERRVRVEIEARNRCGELKLRGHAIIALA